jgi:hypothetical protein
MTRDNRSAWRKLLDTFVADPQGSIEELKRYVRDVRAGADPIEALHGHVCSASCWHSHGRSAFVTWPKDGHVVWVPSDMGEMRHAYLGTGVPGQVQRGMWSACGWAEYDPIYLNTHVRCGACGGVLEAWRNGAKL